jgi:hypothetical protein
MRVEPPTRMTSFTSDSDSLASFSAFCTGTLQRSIRSGAQLLELGARQRAVDVLRPVSGGGDEARYVTERRTRKFLPLL